MKKFTTILSIIMVFILTGCFIDEVEQSSTVEAGGVFTTTLTITDMNAENTNPHKGALAILVPEDWEFIDGTYESPVGSGIMEKDPAEMPVWGNVDSVLPPPTGMKWLTLLTDTGYLHDANMVYETTVNLQTGETTGEFNIGYLVTVNTKDMLAFLNDEDFDQDDAGADTSMNHLVTVTPATGVKETVKNGIPTEYNLGQNYPNPFNPNTTINYSIPNASEVKIAVYDVTGKEVEVLVSGYKDAGNYSLNFDAGNLSSGVYYYKITSNGYSESRKMLLLK